VDVNLKRQREVRKGEEEKKTFVTNNLEKYRNAASLASYLFSLKQRFQTHTHLKGLLTGKNVP
jgi:hypothetical protein